ncbi:hypothetical protein IJ103_00650 [Candidatus Saccharibacteria bacterium]|nr:hypothetical protein [Candidatus Saccharibacteria bacterium]MBQ9016741.1 hypothetical protein [Candidatus Saccharibacteria bacterium]
MNTAEWIIVIILAVTLFIFLLLSIIVLIKVIKLMNEAHRFIETGQELADKASGVANNLYEMTLVGSITGLVKRIKKQYNKYKKESDE